MQTDKKTFAVRDVSRYLIAFGIIIIVVNLNHYWPVYLFGAFTLVVGILNLFSLNLKLKFIGSVNMVAAGIYFLWFALLLYPGILGLVGELIISGLGLVLMVLGLRFIIYYLSNKNRIRY